MEITLDKLPINEIGKVIKLNVNENLKRRLLDLGLVYGTEIKKLYKSPLNDPTAYLIRGSVIALREEDTKNILIFYDCKSKLGGDLIGIDDEVNR